MEHLHYLLWAIAGVVLGMLAVGLWNSTVGKTVPALAASV